MIANSTLLYCSTHFNLASTKRLIEFPEQMRSELLSEMMSQVYSVLCWRMSRMSTKTRTAGQTIVEVDLPKRGDVEQVAFLTSLLWYKKCYTLIGDWIKLTRVWRAQHMVTVWQSLVTLVARDVKSSLQWNYTLVKVWIVSEFYSSSLSSPKHTWVKVGLKRFSVWLNIKSVLLPDWSLLKSSDFKL